jgi:hypothetical protein
MSPMIFMFGCERPASSGRHPVQEDWQQASRRQEPATEDNDSTIEDNDNTAEGNERTANGNERTAHGNEWQRMATNGNAFSNRGGGDVITRCQYHYKNGYWRALRPVVFGCCPGGVPTETP